MRHIDSMSRGMPWPQTGENQYHAQLELQEKVVQSKVWLKPAMIRI